MTPPDTLVLLLVLALAILGALRLDLLGLLWREWLKLGSRPAEAPGAESDGHGPYVVAQARGRHHHDAAQAHKPAYHRSGRRA